MNRKSLDEKYDEAKQVFAGIAESMAELIRPPNDLNPKRRGILVCLAVGTSGIIGLTCLHAPWYAFVAEVVLCILIAILVGYKFRK